MMTATVKTQSRVGRLHRYINGNSNGKSSSNINSNCGSDNSRGSSVSYSSSRQSQEQQQVGNITKSGMSRNHPHTQT